MKCIRKRNSSLKFRLFFENGNLLLNVVDRGGAISDVAALHSGGMGEGVSVRANSALESLLERDLVDEGISRSLDPLSSLSLCRRRRPKMPRLGCPGDA